MRTGIFESGKKKLRIQKYPDTCGRDFFFRIRCRIRRMRVDGSRIRKEKVVDSKICGCVWTGPYLFQVVTICIQWRPASSEKWTGLAKDESCRFPPHKSVQEEDSACTVQA